MYEPEKKTMREENWTGTTGYVTRSNRYLSALNKIGPRAANIFGTIIKALVDERTRTPQLIEKVYTALQAAKDKDIKDLGLRAYFQALIIEPLQEILNLQGIQKTPPDKMSDMIEALHRINQENISQNKRIQLMRDGLTKGSEGRLDISSPPTTRVAYALDILISKLASLNQPLSVRPDYGTTGDMAERLKKIKEKLKTADMIKIIPMQDYDDAMPPQPGLAPIDYDDAVPPMEEAPEVMDYDEGPMPCDGKPLENRPGEGRPGEDRPGEDRPKIILIQGPDEPQIVKQGPPCCEECGQPIPAVMGRDAGGLSKKFKKVREMLNAKELKESQIKEILRSLDEIYHKYNDMEQSRGYQWADKNLNQADLRR